MTFLLLLQDPWSLDEVIKSKMILDDTGSYSCSECSYSSSNNRNVANHIEARHVTTAGAECPLCGKLCPTREALRKHVSRSHKQPPS